MPTDSKQQSPPQFSSHLMAESDGSIGEGLPLFFKCPPLMIELCPAKLKTFPLFQKVGISQFRGDRRSKAVLQIQTKESNSVTHKKVLRGSVWLNIPAAVAVVIWQAADSPSGQFLVEQGACHGRYQHQCGLHARDRHVLALIKSKLNQHITSHIVQPGSLPSPSLLCTCLHLWTTPPVTWSPSATSAWSNLLSSVWTSSWSSAASDRVFEKVRLIAFS